MTLEEVLGKARQTAMAASITARADGFEVGIQWNAQSGWQRRRGLSLEGAVSVLAGWLEE